MSTTRVTYTALPDGEALPTEFRIFKAGLNGASHDPALFDAESARAVMADYEAHGVDLIVDLEHDSLAEQAVRSDMRDARAHFKLELRNGELWAVDVRWTPDGERRLREKTQRFISPAFEQDPKTGRVMSLLNVGLVAMPATHGAPALVAASKRALLSEGSFEARREAIAAALLAAYPPPVGGMCSPCVYAVEVFEDRVVYELSGKLYMAPYTFDAGAAKLGAPVQVTRTYTPVSAAALRKQAPRVSVKMSAVEARADRQAIPGECMPPEEIQAALDALIAGDSAAALEVLKKLIVAAAGGTSEPADPASADPTAAAADTAALAALRADHTATLVRLTALEAERDEQDNTARVELVAELVKLRAETPATAWSDPAKRIVAKRLAAEPVADMRSRVAALRAAAPATTQVEPPESGAADITKLSKSELAACKKHNMDPAEYAERKAKAVRRSA